MAEPSVLVLNERISNSLDSLVQVIQTLEANLEPVLRTDIDAEAEDSGGNTLRGLPKAIEELLLIESRIGALTAKVSEINTKLMV